MPPLEPTMETDAARRWRLALGGEDQLLNAQDQRLSQALGALYEHGEDSSSGRGAGLGRSAPRVARWLGDIREFFPSSVVQVIQKDAFERLGLREMLLEPEFLASVQADVHLVADLVAMNSAMPDKTRECAREVISKVVAELMARLQQRTSEALRGAVDRSRRTSRPRFRDIDWPRTIRANLQHYQPDFSSVVPERLVGYMRRSRRLVDLDEVILCVDQSGSMAPSVVYASIFAAVMASLPVVRTKLVCFDTAVVDFTEQLADPVEVLFGVQLGGGTDINRAVAYCEAGIQQPSQCHMVLITDLYEGGDESELLARIRRLIGAGVNLIVLLALSDSGRPCYDAGLAAQIASLGAPVFACTPDQFPDMMACALKRQSLEHWASSQDIALVRAAQES